MLTALALLSAGAVVSCTSDTGSDTAGAADFSLIIGSDDVDRVAFEITCDDGTSLEGEFEVVDDRDPPVWAAVMDLPVGDCSVTLTAFGDDGEPLCSATEDFTVIENDTVKVNLVLVCTVGGTDPLGNVDIDATFEIIEGNLCPRLHFLGAIPSTIGDDGTSEITVLASDPDGDPVTTTLSATSGSFGDVNASNTVYTCDGAGAQTISVTASDGDAACDKEKEVEVTCPGVDLCAGVDCSDGNECTSDVCDPADGSCSNPVDTGASCDGGAGTCDAAGVCQPNDLCIGVDCDDTNECTIDACDPATGNCSNTPDVGASCDGGNGACDANGDCQPNDLCIGVDCDDTNECTVDACDPATGNCSNTPDTGASCDGGNGTCDANGDCQPNDLCIGVDCDDTNECTIDACDPATGNCSNTPDDGASCDGGNGTCDANGDCQPNAVDYPATSAAIPAACIVSFNGALADFPVDVTIDPGPISAGQPFTADITASAVVTEDFIGAALAVIPTLTDVDVNLAQATIAPVANATGADVTSSLSPVPQTFNLIADTDGNGVPGPLVVDLSAEVGNYTAGASGTTIEFDLVGSTAAVPSATHITAVVLSAITVEISCEPGTANDNGTPDDDSDDFVNPQDPAARISFDIP